MKPFLFFIFGWPGVLLAMLTYGLALASRRAAVAYAAAALSAPFLLYASGYPRIHVMGLDHSPWTMITGILRGS